MEWIESITEALKYIENDLSEDLSNEKIAQQVNISPFYFQKGFSMLCGIPVMEYVRNRRLTLAGEELTSGKGLKVIDIAFRYGYDSVDGFTKAFTRFHGITPSEAMKDGTLIKSFAPLKLQLTMKGGYLMDYKIMNKAEFTVIGSSKMFNYENCKETIPEFWKEHYASGKGKVVYGSYGINIAENKDNEQFEYLIADDYDPTKDLPAGFITKTIPSFTWAIFPCIGAMPEALQLVNKKIFAEWLPATKEYEFASGYCVEYYDDPCKYPKGTKDENYYSEIWIPVKKK